MKKFLSIFFVFFFYTTIFAEGNLLSEKYIDGYEDLKWGTSVAEVKTKYPYLIKETTADCQSGEECYSSQSGSVTRFFRFYNDALYWVRVVYENLTQTQFDALGDKLISKYGTLFFDIDEDDRIKFGYEWLLFTDLDVILSVNNSFNAFGRKIGEWVGVTYSSPSIIKEMQASESEKIEL